MSCPLEWKKCRDFFILRDPELITVPGTIGLQVFVEQMKKQGL
jgi:hypothetical protein